MYNYIQGNLLEQLSDSTYTYGDEEWGDLLTAFDGVEIINNPFGQSYPLWDYLFMVQTSDGGWAEKHGPGGATVYHAFGNPETISWDLPPEFTGFYNSRTIYLAVSN